MTERDDEAKETPVAEPSEGQGTTGEAGPPERPQETFKKGVGLLWQAARAAADEIKREVDKGGVQESIQQAGKDLEEAATMAAKALEGFIERAGGTPAYTDEWPPGEAKTDEPSEAKEEPAAKADAPKSPDDGEGSDDDGDQGDVRIQVD